MLCYAMSCYVVQKGGRRKKILEGEIRRLMIVVLYFYQIVGSRGRTLAGRLEHPQHRSSNRGTVVVSAEEQSQSKRVIK